MFPFVSISWTGGFYVLTTVGLICFWNNDFDQVAKVISLRGAEIKDRRGTKMQEKFRIFEVKDANGEVFLFNAPDA